MLEPILDSQENKPMIVNILLKLGVTNSLEFYNWCNSSGEVEQNRNITIILNNEESDLTKRWEFLKAWPCKYIGQDSIIKGDIIAIENLKICIANIGTE